MSKEERRKSKLAGPWNMLHTAIWLFGIVILAVNNWWWPGILVLVGVSLILQAVLRQVKPDAFEAPEENEAWGQPIAAPPSPEPPAVPAPASPSPAVSAHGPEHPVELLPPNCPKCGGPIRAHEVAWSGPRSVDCPFCGANLPLAKS